MDDAFGRALSDYYHGRYDGRAIYRRETGSVDEVNVSAYFAPPSRWAVHTKALVSRVEGRVLDVGCGAGRTSLALQRGGHDVLAVDRSPLAVRTSSERGVRSVAMMDLRTLGARPRTFDSVLVVGQQHCSVDGPGALGERLESLRQVVASNGRLVADFTDPTHESILCRRGELNWSRGDVAIHRFAVEYGDYADPTTTRLMLSPSALERAVAETGWEIETVIPGSESTYGVEFRSSSR